MAQPSKLTLSDVLSSDNESLLEKLSSGKDQENHQMEEQKIDGMCVECGDQPFSIHCEQCCDDYCEVCFQAIHKKGTRKRHVTKPIKPIITQDDTLQTGTSSSSIVAETTKMDPKSISAEHSEGSSTLDLNESQDSSDNDDDDSQDDDEDMAQHNIVKPQSTLPNSTVGNTYLERTSYIPLRLHYSERKALRLLEAAMKVSEYTDKVDIVSYKSKASRIHVQVKDICAILCGLVVACDYPTGQALVKEKDFSENEEFFQGMFEIGRRWKIMNPEKLRGEYGKLMYMLMDTQIPEIQELLQFSCVSDIKMVRKFLEDRNGSALLQDDIITIATREIIPDGKTRYTIQGEIKQKERAIEILSKKYANSNLSPDEIKHCLYSIGDNNAYLRQSRDPCAIMIQYLKKYFKPDQYETNYSLGIIAGRGGARLTHSHQSQYHYAMQSLMLWHEVQHDMFKLWYYAEQDLLNTSQQPYRLRDTGQGLNRVQPAPRLYKAMSTILWRVQQKVGNWIGSSVIHMGDHNVPNSLMFIDKYTQVPRILNPVVLCLNKIDALVQNDDGIAKYINSTFGGTEKLKREILVDFFRHAFDGSGADNFFDAGSCIDGRLTSAWNWCNKIEKKHYFPVFLLTGFTGFDGQFG